VNSSDPSSCIRSEADGPAGGVNGKKKKKYHANGEDDAEASVFGGWKANAEKQAAINAREFAEEDAHTRSLHEV
jgi:hypothetical protein